jgi:hypothetical protein
MGQNTTAVPAGDSTIDDFDVLEHELGNVLHGVACVAGLLRESGLDAQQQRWLAAIERACGQMRDILGRSRRPFTLLEAETDGVRMNGIRLLEDVVMAHAPAAAGKGIDLLLLTPPGLPSRWRGDACRLRQVLDNLVGNAIRYTPHGRVVVGARPAADDSRELVVTVEDSGPGIEDAECLFDAYRRGEAGRIGEPGRGLGLYVARHMVRRMGGDIHCRNRRSGGARFEVRLPGTLEPMGEGRAPPAMPGLACRLELEPDWRRSVAALLDRLGVAYPGGAAEPSAATVVIRHPAGAGGRRGAGVLLRLEQGAGPAVETFVPAPVLEATLEGALCCLLLESRRGGRPPGS